jgi:hypothetical protein
MTLNESIVEDAALEWFGEQFRCAPSLTPALCLWPSPLRSGSQRENEAIRRLNPALSEPVFSTRMPNLF